MSYQVLARKWRPKRFDEVVGQAGVTRTLRHAIERGRIAQAFVFAGPRGVGKTTTARILARALNCVDGPTTEPCGRCEACVEIAEGRDMDVLEIDAATHTGVDNVREVIIGGLAIPPVRDRYKLFIIDEVHQLSSSSFNALLKSIEEPPPHVVFVMATTELRKIPDTITSRSQVFEFRTISVQEIRAQLRHIADAEAVAVPDEALGLVARAADGSMRDAQTAFDQVIAFAGDTISLEDVSAVLGLVGRDLLMDTLQAVADEDGPAAFALAGRAVEAGYDLRNVCRELSRLVRDLLVLNVDPSRIEDPEIAPEGDRPRLGTLVKHFSREDLLRAFDLLTRTEAEIRTAAEPQYHFEIALLKWMYLRKLVPIAELIERLQSGRPAPAAGPGVGRPAAAAPQGSPGAARPSTPSERFGARADRLASPPSSPRPSASAMRSAMAARQAPQAPAPTAARPEDEGPHAEAGPFDRQEFLAAIQRRKAVFYNTVVAQAQQIEVNGDRVVFGFLPVHRILRERVEQERSFLESLALEVSGRRMAVTAMAVEGAAASPSADRPQPAPSSPSAAAPSASRPGASEGNGPSGGTGNGDAQRLREEALQDNGVKALFDVFPAEIRDVEEM